MVYFYACGVALLKQLVHELGASRTGDTKIDNS